MLNFIPTVSVVTLNVNGIKGAIKKYTVRVYFLKKTHFYFMYMELDLNIKT